MPLPPDGEAWPGFRDISLSPEPLFDPPRLQGTPGLGGGGARPPGFACGLSRGSPYSRRACGPYRDPYKGGLCGAHR